jgi:hypothetical protein
LLQLLPAILSLLVLGAHFLRAGNVLLLVAAFALLGLLAVRRPWAARIVQAALVVGAFMWLRTLLLLASVRAMEGLPARRMVLILLAVAVFTAASALVFRTARARAWYRIDAGKAAPGSGPA